MKYSTKEEINSFQFIIDFIRNNKLEFIDWLQSDNYNFTDIASAELVNDIKSKNCDISKYNRQKNINHFITICFQYIYFHREEYLKWVNYKNDSKSLYFGVIHT